MLGVQVRAVAAKAPKVLGRQVDASAAQILGDVLAVLGQLQRSADRVRAAHARGRGGVEHVQHELADRVCGQRAVAAQLLPGVIRADPLVDAVCLDQARERLTRQPALAQRGFQRDQQRPGGAALEGAVELALELIQRRQPRLGRVRRDCAAKLCMYGRIHVRAVRRLLRTHRPPIRAGRPGVPDFVDQPREPVQREQVPAQPPRQRAAGDREVLPGGARHHGRRLHQALTRVALAGTAPAP